MDKFIKIDKEIDNKEKEKRKKAGGSFINR